MDAEKQVMNMLTEHGFKLVSMNGHRGFRDGLGRRWTTPTTSSDHHSWKNNLHDLRNFLKRGGKCRGVFGFEKITAKDRIEADALLRRCQQARG